MAAVRVSFLRQLCRLRKSVTPHVPGASSKALGARVVEPSSWLHAPFVCHASEQHASRHPQGQHFPVPRSTLCVAIGLLAL